MTKTEWQDTYRVLEKALSAYRLSHSISINGKNKKVRAEAKDKVDDAIRIADNHIMLRADVYNLAVKGASGQGGSIMYEEFISPRYFGDDMNDLLGQIRKTIASLPDE